jgi:hypothetical protein
VEFPRKEMQTQEDSQMEFPDGCKGGKIREGRATLTSEKARSPFRPS